jgi:precorrin-8X/cobalt-precorrin-8 methylmutase
MTMDYRLNPRSIEEESFRIIRNRLLGHRFGPGEQTVVERVIHATADFSYAETLRFSPEAVSSGVAALQRGCTVVTDTRMAWAGINRSLLRSLGVRLLCALDAEGVEVVSRAQGVTRAMVSMKMVAEREREALFLVGNAPTALFALVKLFEEGKIVPPLIVGVPVGLVGAKEAKDALRGTSIPSITTVGSRGGTPVAVAILHALLYLALGESHGRG